MLKRTMTLLAVAMLVRAGTAPAAESWANDMFSLQGFGTLGVAHSNQSQADFVGYVVQPRGAGYSEQWSPDVDSKLGLQLNGRFGSKLSAVIQLLSESSQNNSWTGQPNPRYRPSLEWANVKYEFDSEWSVRAGRIVLPANMISEFRNVGYASSFIRPPVEVYATVPFTSNDGVDVRFRRTFGKAINTFVAGAGSLTLRSGYADSQAENYFATDTVEIGELTLRAAFLRTSFVGLEGLGLPFSSFIAAARALPGGVGDTAAAQAQDLFSRYDLTNRGRVDCYDFGTIYQLQNFTVMAELFRYQSRGIVGTANSGFVSVGYHYAQVTPYLTFARKKQSARREMAIDANGLPPGLAGESAFLSGVIAAIAQGTNTTQQTLSAGMRWDVYKNVDIKMQYDHVSLDAGSTGTFINLQPGFRPGSGADIVSATVDFVF